MRPAAAILTCALLFLTILPSWGGPGPPGRIFCVSCSALSADAKYLAVGLHDSGEESRAGKAQLVFVYRMKDGKRLGAFAGHKHFITQLTFTPDGKHLLSGGADGGFRFWDLGTGKLVWQFEGNAEGNALGCLSKEGKQLLVHVRVPAEKKRDFELYDLNSGKLLRKFPFGKMEVSSMALSGNGKLALLGGSPTAEFDPKRTFGVSGAPFTFAVVDLATGGVVASIDTEKEQCCFNACLLTNKTSTALNRTKWPPSEEPDPRDALADEFIALSRVKREPSPEPNKPDTETFYLALWSVAQQREVRAFPALGRAKNAHPNWAAPTPDGKGGLSRDSDGRLRLWDIDKGKRIWEIATEGETLTFLEGGKQFALLSAKYPDPLAQPWTVRVYSLADGKVVRTTTVKSISP